MARWGKVDYKQLQQFSQKLEQLQQVDIDQFCREMAEELAARLLRKAVKRTPVGQKPIFSAAKSMKVTGESGKSRSFLTREGAILQKYWSGYKGGTLRRGWTTTPLEKTGVQYRIDVINPTKYAIYVEYGHRQTPGRYVPQIGKRLKEGWVKGKFMLTISVQELEQQMPALLEKKLYAKLKEALK